MTLALRRIVWSDGTSRPDDYNIIHGDQIVGRMYRMNEPSSRTHAARSARSHLWNVIRVRSGAPPPPKWKAAGSTRTDPAAQQGLATKGLLSIPRACQA